VDEPIPRVIHYCWFGRGPLPELAEACIRSWRDQCPDFELRLWNEESFDVASHPFTQSAYAAHKYAFVSDYVRALALYRDGGIYLDTDVQLKGPLAGFLEHRAFGGFETRGLVMSAVWGSEPGHRWPDEVMRHYDGRSWSSGEPPNTRAVSSLLETRFGIDLGRNERQLGSDGVVIYPSSMFCLDLPQNVATHHFAGSWLDHSSPAVKNDVHARFYADQFLESGSTEDLPYLLTQLVPRFGFRAILRTLASGALRRVRRRLRRRP